jgi:hypothetical protein
MSWQLKVSAARDSWTDYLFWLMPRSWPLLVGGSNANLILTYPIWCCAAIGIFYGFMLAIMVVQYLSGGMRGLIDTGSALWVIQGTATAHLLEGRLHGQAYRDALAHFILYVVGISPIYSFWGAFKATGFAKGGGYKRYIHAPARKS